MLCYLQVQINETRQDALSLSITLGNKTYTPLYIVNGLNPGVSVVRIV